MKLGFKLSLLLGVFAGFVTSAHAWDYQGSGCWASKNYGTWTVCQDGWGSQDYQDQTLYANSESNWATAGSWSGGGIKCYANAKADVNMPLNGNYWCSSTFNVSAPSKTGALWYDWTYDLWTTNGADEIMIFEDQNPTAGGGSWGSQIGWNVSIGGHTFDVFQADPGWNVILFGNKELGRTSGSEDVWGCVQWAYQNGKLRDGTLRSIGFGVEVTATNGWQQFTCNQFWCGFGDNGGGGGGSVSNGTYKIIARHSGKAMDAYQQGTSNGTKIIQWTYGAGSNQKWTVTNRGGWYSIIGVQSGKSLDIDGWKTGDGTKLQLWDYAGSTNQQFTFADQGSGCYRITPNSATSSALSVAGGTSATQDGATVYLWTWKGATNQQWSFQTP